MGISKRGVLRAVWGATTVGVGGAAALTLGTEPAVAASFTAANVTPTTNDGELNTLTIQPTVDVSWEGMDTAVSEIETTWYVETRNSDGSTVSSGAAGGNGVMMIPGGGTKSGTVSKQADAAWGLLGSPLSAGQFSSDTDGESFTRTVYLTMDLKLIDANANTIQTKTDAVATSFDVTVTNAGTSVTVDGGSANTNAS